ncbi:MAG: PTS sugar transporter subunit IIA [Desulfatibacillum sp.]|nr:PTS sugar transporter subunit IIA [Desulfatibacillum sp.]
MKVSDHMSAKQVFLDAPIRDKEAVLDFVADAFARCGVAPDKESVHACMKEREHVMSTGIGGGVGIPHAACADVTRPAIVLVRPVTPLDFNALDTRLVDVIIAMVVPRNQTSIHLRLLAGISRLIKTKDFLQAVRSASSPEALYSRIRKIEDSMAFH